MTSVTKSMTPWISLSSCSGHAEDVGIILGELAHPDKPVQHSGTFVAMHRAQLKEAQRQVPVAPEPGLVDQHVGQAVHGLDAVDLISSISVKYMFSR